MPAFRQPQVRYVAGRMAQFGLYRTGMPGERPAEPRRDDASSRPREQLYVQRFLKLADGTGQRRLGHIQRLGRRGDTAMIDHREEVEHLADIQISDIGPFMHNDYEFIR